MADRELVEQFQAVAGCSAEEAVHFLEACEGSLEKALELFLQTPGISAASGHSGPAASSSAASPHQNGEADDDDVRAPIPKSQGVLVQESYKNSYAVTRRNKRPVTSSVFERNRDFRAEGEDQYRSLTGANPTAFKDAVKKRKTLASLFQPPEDLIYPGDWDSARNAAQRRSQWLLVNIQNEQEFACQVLNRDVWSNPAVKELVSNNFVFWQMYDNEPEGQRFLTYYSVEAYPFLGIMDPRTGELVLKVKAVDPVSFCESVMTFLESHPTFDSLDQKLSSATQPACSKSEENGSSEGAEAECGGGSRRRKRREEDEDMEQEDLIHNPPKAKVSKKDEKKVERSQAGTQAEYLKYLDGEGPSVIFQFILPDGTRGRRQAFSLNAPLSAVTEFAAGLGFDPRDFDLVLNFPMRVLAKEDPRLSLQEMNLNKQELIRIEEKN